MPKVCQPGAALRGVAVLCLVGAPIFGLVRTSYSASQLSESEANPLAGCVMCHVDVEYEYVGTPHFAQQVGCRECHGPSEGHIADENNDVKPDRVFTRENVEHLCETCHQFSTNSESSFAAGSYVQVCTDCHGYHDQQLVITIGG